MQAVVLSGNLAPQELRELGIERIYLLKVDGETLLARICRCLVDGGGCDKVFVLAPPEVPLPDIPEVVRGDYDGQAVTNTISCVINNVTDDDVLIASSDMPLVTPESIAALCAHAKCRNVDAVYHAVERRQIEERFPGTKRTYLRLTSGQYSGGNVFWFSRSWLKEAEELLTDMFENRKNIPALARRFGVLFLLRVLTGFADLPYLERHMGKVIGGRLSCAVLPYPELAVDLDKLEDLILYSEYLDELPGVDLDKAAGGH